jgi:hypothetical protein
MSFKFQPGENVSVSDYAGLIAAHKSFGRFACKFLVKGFVVVEPLTDSQFSKLPRYMRDLVSDKREAIQDFSRPRCP